MNVYRHWSLQMFWNPKALSSIFTTEISELRNISSAQIKNQRNQKLFKCHVWANKENGKDVGLQFVNDLLFKRDKRRSQADFSSSALIGIFGMSLISKQTPSSWTMTKLKGKWRLFEIWKAFILRFLLCCYHGN